MPLSRGMCRTYLLALSLALLALARPAVAQSIGLHLFVDQFGSTGSAPSWGSNIGFGGYAEVGDGRLRGLFNLEVVPPFQQAQTLYFPLTLGMHLYVTDPLGPLPVAAGFAYSCILSPGQKSGATGGGYTGGSACSNAITALVALKPLFGGNTYLLGIFNTSEDLPRIAVGFGLRLGW